MSEISLEVASTEMDEAELRQQISALKSGALLGNQKSVETGTYERVIRVDESRDRVWLLRVTIGTPVSSRLPRPESLSRTLKTLRIMPEVVAAPQMQSDWTGEIKPKWAEGKEKRLPVVKNFLEAYPDALGENFRTKLQRFAAGVKTNPRELVRWLTTYWWFGCTDNALLSRGWEQGRCKGKRRITEKLGRANAAERLGDDKRKGVNVTARHKEIFETALNLYWIDEDLPLSTTYALMAQNLFTASTRLVGETECRKFPIDPRRIPTVEQFRYHARKLFERDSTWVARKRKRIEQRQNGDPYLGSAADLSIEPFDVVDLDGVVFDFQLVAGWNKLRRVGTPRVLFAVDRSSFAILGFVIWLKGESWESYRQLLLNVCAPKDTLLAKHGLPASDFPLHGVPSRFFVDNGAGAGLKAKAAMVARLGSDRMRAPSRQGNQKPQVEAINGILQRAMARHNGGYTQKTDERSKVQKRTARNLAEKDYKSFEKALLLEIIDHNNYTTVRHLLTDAMRKDGVEPTPKSICRDWGMKRRNERGVPELEKDEIYLQLLDRVHATVHKDGIKYGSNAYISDDLRTFYEHWSNSGTGRRKEPKQCFIPLPFDASRMLWERDDGSRGIVTQTEQSAASHPMKNWEATKEAITTDQYSEIKVRHNRTQRGLMSDKDKSRAAKLTGAKLPTGKKDGGVKKAREFEQRNIESELAERDAELLNIGTTAVPSGMGSQQPQYNSGLPDVTLFYSDED